MKQDNGRILIVNTQSAYAEFLKRNIEMAFPALEIMVAESGEAALELVNRSNYDLIITDLMLPGMGGLNLFYELKGRYPWLKTILLSDSLDIKRVKVLKQQGLFGYVEKPFLMENLSDLITHAIG